MIPSCPISALDYLDDGQPISCGGLRRLPTPEEIAAFELGMDEARAKFMATAMAEDGMSISAGLRGAEVERKVPLEERAEAPNLTETNASG